MKILHILTDSHTGGAQKFCIDLCNVQSYDPNYEVYLCILDSLSEELPLIKTLSPIVNLISLNKQGAYSLKIIFKIFQLLSELKPDIIHLNGRALIYASLPILIKKIPSCYTVHTMADKEYNRYFTSYIKYLFNNKSDLFTPVAISNIVGKTLKNTYGKQLDNVIINGSSKMEVSVNLDVVLNNIKKIKKDKHTFLFTYVGRIGREKNTMLLIKAFNKILSKGENVILYIIGPDSSPKKDYLELCIKANQYPDKIKFLGNKENIADYLYATDALCITSHYEGLGIAALEAFSMGKPVLSTPCGGPNEIIIPNLNGYVSKFTTLDDYVDILTLFLNKPLMNKEGIIQIYEEKYTMKVCAEKYLELYNKNINFIDGNIND